MALHCARGLAPPKGSRSQHNCHKKYSFSSKCTSNYLAAGLRPDRVPYSAPQTLAGFNGWVLGKEEDSEGRGINWRRKGKGRGELGVVLCQGWTSETNCPTEECGGYSYDATRRTVRTLHVSTIAK